MSGDVIGHHKIEERGILKQSEVVERIRVIRDRK